jgi:hypothetical protein
MCKSIADLKNQLDLAYVQSKNVSPDLYRLLYEMLEVIKEQEMKLAQGETECTSGMTIDYQ